MFCARSIGATQRVARVALVGLQVRRDDVAEHARDALVLWAPRQDREGRRVGHGDHVGLFDRVETGDRGAVEAGAAVEGVAQLGAVDREALELTEDVGEPEAHEANVVLLDLRHHVIGGIFLSGTGLSSVSGATDRSHRGES